MIQPLRLAAAFSTMELSSIRYFAIISSCWASSACVGSLVGMLGTAAFDVWGLGGVFSRKRSSSNKVRDGLLPMGNNAPTPAKESPLGWTSTSRRVRCMYLVDTRLAALSMASWRTGFVGSAFITSSNSSMWFFAAFPWGVVLDGRVDKAPYLSMSSASEFLPPLASTSSSFRRTALVLRELSSSTVPASSSLVDWSARFVPLLSLLSMSRDKETTNSVESAAFRYRLCWPAAILALAFCRSRKRCMCTVLCRTLQLPS
mmetsp:Transcript_15170/g.22252  ORF Transcript_15170/g.22252 Transcript_15170/m.22252 type:complete len:259 (+) Transcript_15170:816-1592(+)